MLLIALLAGLLATWASRRDPTIAAVPTATASTVATPASGDQWQSIDSYTHVPGLVLAPSNARVAYQDAQVSSQPGATALTMQRTHDAGATWQAVALPTRLSGVAPSDYEGTPTFTVSPRNPNVVYLRASAHMPSCPNHVGQEGAAGGVMLEAPRASGPLCFTEYYSTDGATSWHDLHLPANGLLGPAQAQDARLWALISPPNIAQDTTAPAGRLVRSADGGVTWTLADSSLPTAVGIAAFAPAPSGNTIFVVTDRADRFNAGGCSGCLPPPDYGLWRSDDLGAHWIQVSALPYQSVAQIAVARASTSTQPTVYLQVLIDTQGTLALVTSADGGHDWAPAPSAGLTPGSAQVEGTLAVLADGSAMLIDAPAASPGAHTFYAYKPGDAGWRPIAPQLASLAVQPPTVGAAGTDGSQTITLLYEDQDGNRVATHAVH
jgi:hypothetical protein